MSPSPCTPDQFMYPHGPPRPHAQRQQIYNVNVNASPLFSDSVIRETPHPVHSAKVATQFKKLRYDGLIEKPKEIQWDPFLNVQDHLDHIQPCNPVAVQMRQLLKNRVAIAQAAAESAAAKNAREQISSLVMFPYLDAERAWILIHEGDSKMCCILCGRGS